MNLDRGQSEMGHFVSSRGAHAATSAKLRAPQSLELGLGDAIAQQLGVNEERWPAAHGELQRAAS
jgi:hypothetical protein